MRLRADVAHQMRCGRSVSIDMAIETRDSLHARRAIGFAIAGRVELLLRELRDQQPNAFQILRVQNSLEDFLEVVDRHDFPLRDVT